MSEIKLNIKDGELGVYVAYKKDGKYYISADENYTLEKTPEEAVDKCIRAIKQMVAK